MRLILSIKDDTPVSRGGHSRGVARFICSFAVATRRLGRRAVQGGVGVRVSNKSKNGLVLGRLTVGSLRSEVATLKIAPSSG